MEGKKIEWDGFSNPVQCFLQDYSCKKGIDFFLEGDFHHCFSDTKPDICVSYVWASTKLGDIAGGVNLI
jgi:hypothetical protein